MEKLSGEEEDIAEQRSELRKRRVATDDDRPTRDPEMYVFREQPTPSSGVEGLAWRKQQLGDR